MVGRSKTSPTFEVYARDQARLLNATGGTGRAHAGDANDLKGLGGNVADP